MRDLTGRKCSSLKPSSSKSVQKTVLQEGTQPTLTSPGQVRVSREVELRASEPWSGRRGCQVLPAANGWAVFLAESLRPRVATVRVAETVGGLVFGLGEDMLVAPTNVFVPASTGLLQQRKSSAVQGCTQAGSCSCFLLAPAPPSPASTHTLCFPDV